MTCETKISKGYQTVVPAELRKAYDIAPGDKLVWERSGSTIKIRVRKRKTWADITGMINVGGDAVEWKKKAQRGEL
jgi:bifunctional DNA-binding transcriptional regulator/antitoxin component of YhaV-PrlF toxin-antitoxin module